MKTLLIIILLASTIWSTAYGAELLVQARDGEFETSAKKGYVIVVRPDGWSWGREERLPRYVVIKMPGVPVEDAKHYEQTLMADVEREETISIDATVYEDAKKLSDYLTASNIQSVTSAVKSIETVESYKTAEGGSINLTDSKVGVMGENNIVSNEISEKEVYTVTAKRIVPEMVRKRKYAIPRSDVDALIATNTSVKTVPAKSITTYRASIVAKDVVTEKALIQEAVALKELSVE